jgi:serine/threonine protein kinase/tetratricopeptide (TPR) repeat protein
MAQRLPTRYIPCRPPPGDVDVIGRTLAQYTVLEKLGAGGMGEVYRANDSRLGRDVALKMLPDSVAGDPERLHRFTLEARLLASLNHSNIGAIYDLVEADDARFLVLELVEGETLSQRIARGALPTREALKVGRQIAAAVEVAHEQGIIHRDLKPDNVMLTKQRTVKVLDFGLAKGGTATPGPAATQLRTQTAKGVVLGTAPYMSPEQARGREMDRRTDVWAFGCILYECLTGHRAFSGETGSDVIARILERDPEWRDLPPSVPTRLGDLIRSCLRKEVDQRPRDIGDLRRELDAIESDLSSASFGSSPALRTVPSLAVLYFENQSGDAEDDYFCSGVTEDILTDLSKIRGLRVASRNAVLPFRGQAVDIPKVAAELAVDAVLEGSVRRAGDRVRITAQLINGPDGFQLWAERYDRTLQDVFAVQEEIASAITEALRVALTPAEAEHLVKDRPNDARAYDLYLQGREQYNRYTRESLGEALRLFEEAVAVDPDYALAWAGIADTRGQMCQYEFTDDPEEEARLGLEAAAHAIRLNPGLAEGYKAQGLVRRFTGDPEGSRASLIQALEVNPRLTPALINLAVQQCDRADLAGAEQLVRRCLEVDPQENFARVWTIALLFNTGRYEEAMALSRELRNMATNNFYVTGAHYFVAVLHLKRGDEEGAERAIREGRADGAESSHMRAAEARLLAVRGQVDEARKAVGELEDDRALTTGALLSVAAAAVRIGEREAAVKMLDRKTAKDLAPVFLRLDPDLHPLASHEAFAPRRLDAVLNWPLEAPMIDPASFALFREVRIRSGRPEGSDLQLDRYLG